MGFSTAFWVYLLIFLGILLFGGPIYMALLCSGMAYVFIHGRIDQLDAFAFAPNRDDPQPANTRGIDHRFRMFVIW